MKAAERANQEWLQSAMAMYRELREVYPGYTRMPEVLFALAQAYWSQEQYQEAIDVYADLIRVYPESPLVSDAWLGFGEFYFENNDVNRALRSYQKAAKDRRSRVYGFALYKQGWCYFNLSEWEKALEKFKATVFYSQLASELSGENKIALGREAQKDFVRTYAHVGNPRRAPLEFADLLSENDCTSDRCRKLLDQLAGLWFESGYFAESAALYRTLIAGRPDDLRNTYRQARIVDLVSRLGSKKATVAESKKLVASYQKLEALAGESPEAADAFESAQLLAQSTIRRLAQVWNAEARKTKTKSTFAHALTMYEDYLAVFDDAESSYEMRFQLADLYYKLERFDEAANAYRMTVLAEPEGKHVVDAANDRILAIEEHLRDLDIETPKGGTEPVEIHPQMLRLIDACQMYVQFVPEDKAEQREKVRFRAAKILYDYNHFDEALPRFESIVNEAPRSEQAEYSANLVVDIHNLREDWGALYATASAYRANEALVRGRPGLAKDLARFGQFAKFKLVQALEAQAAAGSATDRQVAQAYEDFYAEYPRSPNADKALFNASLAWDRAGQKERARALRQRLLVEFEDSPLRADVAHYVARQHEERTEFLLAADAFLAFARNYPEDERAQDAMYNASVFYAGVNRVKTAAEVRLNYIERYGRSKTGETADLYWTVAVDLERGDRIREAAERYASFRKQFPKDSRFWDALGREAALRSKLRQTSTAAKLRRELERRYRAAGRDKVPEAGRKWVALYALEDLEQPYQRFIKTRIVRPNLRNPKPFQKSVAAKSKARDELIQSYTRIVTRYQQADSTLAALNRIAGIWTDFVAALTSVPCPRGLNEDACFVFKDEIQTMAAPAQEAGLEAYRACAQKSRELGLFTRDSTRCMEALEEQGAIPTLIERPAAVDVPVPLAPPAQQGPLLEIPDRSEAPPDSVAEVQP